MTSSRMRHTATVCALVLTVLTLSACGSTNSNISTLWYDQRWESSSKE